MLNFSWLMEALNWVIRLRESNMQSHSLWARSCLILKEFFMVASFYCDFCHKFSSSMWKRKFRKFCTCWNELKRKFYVYRLIADEMAAATTRASSTWASAARTPTSSLAATTMATTTWVPRLRPPPPLPGRCWESERMTWASTGRRSTRRRNYEWQVSFN